MGCGTSSDDTARLAARARGGLSSGGAMTPSPGNSFMPSQIPTIIVTPPSLLPPSPGAGGMMSGPPPPLQHQHHQQHQQHHYAQDQPVPPPPPQYQHQYQTHHPHQPMHPHSHSPIRVDTGPTAVEEEIYGAGCGPAGFITTTPVPVMSSHHSFSDTECTSPVAARKIATEGGGGGGGGGARAVSAGAVCVGVHVGGVGGVGPSSCSSPPSANSPHSSLSILTAVQSANRANALASAQDGGLPRHVIHPPRGAAAAGSGGSGGGGVFPMHPESPSVKPRSTYAGHGRLRSVDADGDGDGDGPDVRGDARHRGRDATSLDAYDPDREAEHRIFQFRDNEHVQIPGVALGAGLGAEDARTAEGDRDAAHTPTPTFGRRASGGGGGGGSTGTSRAGSGAPSPTNADAAVAAAAAAAAFAGLGPGAASSPSAVLRGQQPRLATSEVHG